MFRLAFACLVIVVACSAIVESPHTLQGTYTLTSVNDHALPVATVSIPPEVLQLTGGWLSLAADSTFIDSTFERIVTQLPDRAPTVQELRTGVAGSWSVRAGDLRLRGGNGEYHLTVHEDGSLTRFIPRQYLGGPYLDLTYRYQKGPR